MKGIIFGLIVIAVVITALAITMYATSSGMVPGSITQNGIARGGTIARDGIARDGIARDGIEREGTIVRDGIARDIARDDLIPGGTAQDSTVKDKRNEKVERKLKGRQIEYDTPEKARRRLIDNRDAYVALAKERTNMYKRRYTALKTNGWNMSYKSQNGSNFTYLTYSYTTNDNHTLIDAYGNYPVVLWSEKISKSNFMSPSKMIDMPTATVNLSNFGLVKSTLTPIRKEEFKPDHVSFRKQFGKMRY